MSTDEMRLLEALLFDENVSRNRQFALFEENVAKRAHRVAKMLRNLHKEIQTEDTRHWIEELDDGRLCLHLHQPEIGAMRQVFLTPEQWTLLQRM